MSIGPFYVGDAPAGTITVDITRNGEDVDLSAYDTVEVLLTSPSGAALDWDADATLDAANDQVEVEFPTTSPFATAGVYTMQFRLSVGGVAPTEYSAPLAITVYAVGYNPHWATVDEVSAITGTTVTYTQLAQAQSMIEGAIKRPRRASDDGTGDAYWLKRAVAWQARHVKDNPQIVQQAGLTSISQDGFSASWSGDASAGGGMLRFISPVAMSFLNNLGNGANTTLRVNSGFQRGGSRLGYRRGLAWRPIGR